MQTIGKTGGRASSWLMGEHRLGFGCSYLLILLFPFLSSSSSFSTLRFQLRRVRLLLEMKLGADPLLAGSPVCSRPPLHQPQAATWAGGMGNEEIRCPDWVVLLGLAREPACFCTALGRVCKVCWGFFCAGQRSGTKKKKEGGEPAFLF